jgi:hypothetical protein
LQLSSATAHLSRRCEELPRMLAAGVEDRDYRQSMFLLGPTDRLGEAGICSERQRAGSRGCRRFKSCCPDHAEPGGYARGSANDGTHLRTLPGLSRVRAMPYCIAPRTRETARNRAADGLNGDGRSLCADIPASRFLWEGRASPKASAGLFL